MTGLSERSYYLSHHPILTNPFLLEYKLPQKIGMVVRQYKYIPENKHYRLCPTNYTKPIDSSFTSQKWRQKAANPHIQEDGTSKLLTLFLEKVTATINRFSTYLALKRFTHCSQQVPLSCKLFWLVSTSMLAVSSPPHRIGNQPQDNHNVTNFPAPTVM